VPEFMKANKKDPFDYKLQTKEEVDLQYRMGLNHIPLWVKKSWYVKDDVKAKDPRIDYMNITAKLSLNIHKMKLSTQQ